MHVTISTMRKEISFLGILVVSCTSRVVTPGAVEGSRVWFAETEKPTVGSDKIAIIACDAKALPPCIRFAARDVHTAGEVQRWAEESRSGSQPPAPPPSAPAGAKPPAQ